VKTVRIKGLVRIASYIRQELSGPLSAERRAVLQKRVRSALQQVDDIVKQAGATAESLAAPSRKAYQFLSTLDFDAINSSEAAPANNYPAGSIFFQGLRGVLHRPSTHGVDLLRRLRKLMDTPPPWMRHFQGRSTPCVDGSNRGVRALSFGKGSDPAVRDQKNARIPNATPRPGSGE